MSVVNKMLNDLESRQQLETAHQGPLQKDYVAPNNNKIMYACSLFVLTISFVLFSITAYLLFSDSQATQQVPLQETELQYEPAENDQYASISRPQDAPLSQGQKVVDTPESAMPESTMIASKPNTDSKKDVISQPQKTQLVAKQEALPEIALSDLALEELEEATTFTKAKSSGRQSNQDLVTMQSTVASKSTGNQIDMQLSSLKAQASLASRNNDNDKVMQILQQIVRISPTQSRARKQLAAMLFSASKNQQAADLLKSGLNIEPQDSSMRLMLARIYFKEGNRKHAFSLLNSHPYGQLANDELLSFRAALAEKMGDYKVAQNDYLMLVRRNPAEAKWWLGLGVSHDKQSMGEQAIAAYQQAYSLNQLPQQVNEFVQKRIALLERRS